MLCGRADSLSCPLYFLLHALCFVFSSISLLHISRSRLFFGAMLPWSASSCNIIAYPKSLSRLPIWAFPRAQMGFPARWKSLFHVTENALRRFLSGKTLVFRLLSHASKSRVYEGGRLAVSLCAILSDFAPHEYSFCHNHIA